MSDLTFNELVQKLTGENHKFISTDDGQKLVTENGLLDQLRQAVFGGMENGGSGSAFGSKPPIDAAALDLLEEITVQATEALAQVDPRPTPYGQAEKYVALFAAAVEESAVIVVTALDTLADDVKTAHGVPRVYRRKVEATALNHVRRWVAQIEAFFNPPSLGEIIAPCPNCEVEFTWKTVDGQAIPSRVFNFHRDRVTGETYAAKCSHCGQEYGPVMFERLARVLGALAEEETIAEVVERMATRGK